MRGWKGIGDTAVGHRGSTAANRSVRRAGLPSTCWTPHLRAGAGPGYALDAVSAVADRADEVFEEVF